MRVKLQNDLTRQYYSHGHWNSDREHAQWIEMDSPEWTVLKHTWDLSNVQIWTDDRFKGLDLIQKSHKLRENASTNRSYLNKVKVERMLKGRADAMYAKGIMLLGS